jgi:PIN domain nuclease of toxin-antitoxin system
MSARPLLLDTCALIWIAEGAHLSGAAIEALDATSEAGGDTYVSPISAWEIGLLAARERLKFLITPQRWFQRVLDAPHVRLADMSPEILIASSFLPGDPPRDPADRIIAATARDYGCTVLTRDRELVRYAEQGHLRLIVC